MTRYTPHTGRHRTHDLYVPEADLPPVERFPLWTVVVCLIVGMVIATLAAVVLP